MEEKRNVKKNKALRIVGLVGLFLLVFGISYALFSVTLNGTKKNRITTGRLSLKLTDENGLEETEGYAIDLQDAIPITDAEGLEGTPYTFIVENDGTIPASYTLTLNEDSENTLSTEYIKYVLDEYDYLKKANGQSYLGGKFSNRVKNLYTRTDQESAPNSGPSLLSTITNDTLDATTLLPGEKIKYQLYLWIDHDATYAQAGNKTYEATIHIDGSQAVTRYKGSAGDNVNYNLYNDGTLILTGTGAMSGFTVPTQEGQEFGITNNGSPLLDIAAQYLTEQGIYKELDAESESLEEDIFSRFCEFAAAQYGVGSSQYNYYVASRDAWYGNNAPYLIDTTGYDMNNQSDVEELIGKLDNFPIITRIVIDEGITSISDMAFSNALNYMITLPSTASTLGIYSFYQSRSYAFIIPESATVLTDRFIYGSYTYELTLPSGLQRIEDGSIYTERFQDELFIPNSVQYVAGETISANNVIVDNSESYANANWASDWKYRLSHSTITYLR